jgi:ATP-dependent DNA helicase RecG
MNFSTPIGEIPRVGPQYQKKLKRLGIKTVQDLIYHFPHRYEDFSDLIPISQVKLGETVCVQGEILEIKNIRTWKKRMTLTQALVKDDSGQIKVVWFNQPYLTNTLKEGVLVCLAGKATENKKYGKGLYLSSPTYEKISDKEKQNLIHTGGLIPVYPETEGLSSRWLRYILRPILAQLKSKIADPMPIAIKRENKLMPLNNSVWQIHFPDSKKLAQGARKTLAFHELFLIQLNVLREKMKLKMEKALSVKPDIDKTKRLVDSLPFKLTEAQRKTSWQILKDMEKPRPMNRLLEGDVGSGKTIVAAIATLNTALTGFQTAIMAPTEILTKQHFRNISDLLKSFRIRIGILTNQECKIGNKKLTRKEFLKKIDEGRLNVLIGTHALIQKDVKFNNLALVVLDEQHRFGVDQRAHLLKNHKQKTRLIPHLLSMTATPIPRTLALTLYGDLDLSLLDEMPRGRKKIITELIPPGKRKDVYKFIKEQVKKGRQTFVICPRIESKPTNSLWSETKAVEEEYEKLSKNIFPKLKVSMLHGRMKAKEKEKVMTSFSRGKIDILVSTSVVEVGVDIPNATIMIIEGAEKFGLAQLHQFRGRIGRGKYQSYCFLFTDLPSTPQRLRALLKSESGFELAEKDLQIRGPGEIYGGRQWGIPDLAMASLSDKKLIETTRFWAKEILKKDPYLKKHLLLKEKIDSFAKRIHFE